VVDVISNPQKGDVFKYDPRLVKTEDGNLEHITSGVMGSPCTGSVRKSVICSRFPSSVFTSLGSYLKTSPF